MFRPLALTSSAAVCLLCSACGGGDDNDSPIEPLQDTRSSVTGTHPVTMTMFSPVTSDAMNPVQSQPTLSLTAEPGVSDRLRVSLAPFECTLTATMTGAATFALNQGSCSLIIPPQDMKFGCSITLVITEGTGGRDTPHAKVGMTFNADYRKMCADDDAPFVTPVSVTLVGS
ncbi:hypothetical protein D7Y13_05110 [Corallococcus praedator]|uniref:Lipoprotein n=1 Tax=Corallococcus praedator TaxID=2316724 RepID=A0ABX9QQZ2_9BACT|nr:MULTISPECIES: hypothetical protein [Corallococcus]RKH33699.1 hypothetical protein D7X75_11055 [Corallococcus sp. CA031C]RKI14899.1 hypothetical protein D7Y13_05110 [Corallococcus praedator]